MFSFDARRESEDAFGKEQANARDNRMLSKSAQAADPMPTVDIAPSQTVGTSIQIDQSQPTIEKSSMVEVPFGAPHHRKQMSIWSAFTDRIKKIVNPNHTDRWGY